MLQLSGSLTRLRHRRASRPAGRSSPLQGWLLALASAALLPTASALTPAPGTANVAALPSKNVAWLLAGSDAEFDVALARARAEKKPLLLYWGAVWCPPCNQLKATLFNRQDFAERSQSFVPVFIDGDGAAAQKLAGRFKVRGYPTMILMNPEGAEITRLPGEVEPAQVMQLLQTGLAGGRPVKALLADATAGKALGGGEWRSLAFYGWDTDEAQLVPAAQRPGLLAQLAAACPPTEADAAMRLLLKALAGSDDGQGLKPDDTLRNRVGRLLADPAASRRHMDVLVNFAPGIVRGLAPDADATRAALAKAMDQALAQLQADASLSRGDQVSALIGRIGVARLGQPKDALYPVLPQPLLRSVRDTVARQDREITDGHERQAVITSGAYALSQAGLWAESDALLKANLARSHSPYYLMSQLGSNARQQGRAAEALDWYAQSFQNSQGPATRLQWGAGYLAALVDLAPQDAARIEETSAALLRETDGQQAAFHERSARSLQRVSAALLKWRHAAGTGPADRQAVVERLRNQLAPTCAKLPTSDSQKAVCEGLLQG